MTIGTSPLGMMLTEVWRNPKLADWFGPTQWDYISILPSSLRPFQETSDPSPTATEEVPPDQTPS